MEYKIEKNIQIPALRQRKEYPFKNMNIGDSFIIGEGKARELGNYGARARYWAKNNNLDWKFALRKVEDNKIRIWRIK